jgi:hypothetical protein
MAATSVTVELKCRDRGTARPLEFETLDTERISKFAARASPSLRDTGWFTRDPDWFVIPREGSQPVQFADWDAPLSTYARLHRGTNTVTFILGPPPISTSAAVGAGAPSAGGAGTETAGAGKGRRFLTCPFGFSFVPRCYVAATHTTVSETDRKASFSASKRTVLDDALRRLNIRCLEGCRATVV